jgi:hypothetical protein
MRRYERRGEQQGWQAIEGEMDRKRPSNRSSEKTAKLAKMVILRRRIVNNSHGF